MIEIAIVGGTVLASSALLIDESGVDLATPIKEYFADCKKYVQSEFDRMLKDNKHYQTHLLVKKEVAKAKDLARRKALSKEIQAKFKEMKDFYDMSGCGHWGSDDIHIYCKPEQLSQVRKILRKILGSWSDKIGSTYCADRSETLTAYYDGEYKGMQIQISVEYDLDDLPKGLLKPGCKVVRETKTIQTCRIECEVS